LRQHTVELHFLQLLFLPLPVHPGGAGWKPKAMPSWARRIPTWKSSQWGWQIDPLGLRITMNSLYDR